MRKRQRRFVNALFEMDRDEIEDALRYLDERKRWDLRQAVADGRFYGSGHTMHDTERVGVIISRSGDVRAVWFRCQILPFRQIKSDYDRPTDYCNPEIRLTGVEVTQ